MRDTLHQLQQLSDRARSLRLLQRGLQGVSYLLPILLGLAVLDYVLRLPSAMRLLLGLSLLGIALVWIVTRLRRAWQMKPTLTQLALRGELIYPQLSGKLASAVEFENIQEQMTESGSVVMPDTVMSTPQRTQQLMEQSVSEVEEKLPQIELSRLIDFTPTYRWLGTCVVVMVLFALVNVSTGSLSLIAWQRWLMPLSDVRWPQRTMLESLVTQTYWPREEAVPLQVMVRKGHHSRLRVQAFYRLVSELGSTPWQSSLLSAQTVPSLHPSINGSKPPNSAELPRGVIHERMIEIDPSAWEALGLNTSTPTTVSLEFYFQAAGDDPTTRQQLELAQRPEVVNISAQIVPPVYAQAWMQEKTLVLQRSPAGSTGFAALAGSQITLSLSLNQRLISSRSALDWPRIFPGLHQEAEIRFEEQVSSDLASAILVASWPLQRAVESSVQLVNARGLSDTQPVTLRMELQMDRPPEVVMTQPVVDEAVLPTAVVELQASGQDDVAVTGLSMQAKVERVSSANDSPPSPTDETPTDATTTAVPADAQVIRLTQTQIAGPRVQLDHQLDLTSLQVKPGEVVVVTALAQDSYQFMDQQHEPVISGPRRLLVIDSNTFAGQIRAELAVLREQAARLLNQQQILEQNQGQLEAGELARQQQQLSERLAQQANLPRQLQQRTQRNRFEDPTLQSLLEQSAQLLEQSTQASQQAQQKLQQAQQASDPQQQAEQQAQAQQDQAQVSERLTQLMALLDQGRDSLALRMQLQQMLKLQQALQNEARALMPRTLGKTPEQLDQATQAQLEELAQRQQALSEQAQQMIEQMQASAEQLAQQPNRAEDEAAASALSEAAALARQQGLTQQQQQASAQLKDNQLSAADQAQSQSSDTMQQMLSALAQQSKRQQEVLRRKLLKLVDAIKQLIKQQEALRTQVALQPPPEQLATVETGQSTLRRNTLVTAEEAGREQVTKKAAGSLQSSAASQADAVQSLRDRSAQVAMEQQSTSLAHLQDALRMVEEAKKKNDQALAQQERQQLREQYEKLAARQMELKTRTLLLSQLKEPTRKDRAAMVELGGQQSDIRKDAQQLGTQVVELDVFAHVHDRIAELADRITEQLRSARLQSQTLDQQQMVHDDLMLLAQALAEDENNDEFQKSEGGGGEGGGGGAPPLVPPTAQLKLLRSLQQQVLTQTRELEIRAPEQQPPTVLESAVIDLSVRQRELSALGQRLLEKMMPRSGSGTIQLPTP